MTTKFIHMSDTHLGFTHYNLNERFLDFNRAFKDVLKKALQEEVDFILIAGDMFNSTRMNPDVITAIYMMVSTFRNQCQMKLKREIPLICIEGNHDKSSYFSRRSWMKFLADLNLIILLEGVYNKEENKISFPPYSETRHRGGMIQINDVAIYGVPYYGAYTPKLFPLIYDALPATTDSFNVLMMHFGITGQDREKMGYKIDGSLQKLREKIDYLALGHFHKMYTLPSEDTWIYNPGSLEVNDAREIWGTKGIPYERGVFLAEIHGRNSELNRIQHFACANGSTSEPDEISNRQFVSIVLDINPTVQASSSFSDLTEFISAEIVKIGISRKGDNNFPPNNPNLPFLLLSLFGSVPFSKLDFNVAELREQILTKFSILGLRVFSNSLKSELDNVSIGARDGRSIAEIESEVFRKLIESNPIYKAHTDSIITLMKDLKQPLLESKPNFDQLVTQIQNWWDVNLKEDDIEKLAGSLLVKEELGDDLEEELIIDDDLDEGLIIDDDLEEISGERREE